MDIHLIICIIVIIIAMIGYMIDDIPLEITSSFVIIIYIALFYFFPLYGENGQKLITEQDIILGFAHPALITVISLMIMGQALFHIGALNYLTSGLVKIYKKKPFLIILIIFFFVFILSGLMNNTPVVIMFIPVLIALSSTLRGSNYLMILSFISILGGMLTLVGSSTNLIAAGIYSQITGDIIGFFDQTIPALVLGVVGALYMLIFSKILLPNRKSKDGKENSLSNSRQYISRLEIRGESQICGAQPVAGYFPDLKEISVRMIERDEKKLFPPFDSPLMAGDVLSVAATRNALENVFKSHRACLSDNIQSQIEKNNDELSTVEVVVAPGARVLARSVEQIDFTYQTGCALLGIQRHGRMITTPLRHIRLQAGDVLLILGQRNKIKKLRGNADYLLMEWSVQALPEPKSVILGLSIFITTLAAISTGLLSPLLASLAGACAMLISGCISQRLIKRAIDTRIIMVIGASMAMGQVLDVTGGVHLIANYVVDLAMDFGPTILISATFALAAIMTNLLSNNATVILLTPIAVQTALDLHMPPIAMLITIILGANCSFATPIAYQTNLLIMSPGNYKFSDFVKFGLPLVILLWITYSLFAPIYFHLV